MHRTTRKKKGKKRQVLGIIILAVSVLLFVGVLTGSEYLGEMGEYINKYFLRLTFGYSVLVIPFLLLCFGWFIFFKKSISSIFKFSFYLLVLMLIVSFSLSFFNILFEGKLGDSFNLGGVGGLFLANRAQKLFGSVGSLVLLISIYLIYAFFLFDIDFSRKYHLVEEKIKKLYSKIKKIIDRKSLKRKISFDWIEERKRSRLKKSEPIIAEAEDISMKRKEPTIALNEIKEVEEASVPKVGKMEPGDYVFPPIDLLDYPLDTDKNISQNELVKKAETIEKTLLDFGVGAKVVKVTPGPVITLYEVSPAPGVKISKIAGLSDDLALAMKAKGIRIIAPIPGKAVVGIEIPNEKPSTVFLRGLISSEGFFNYKSKLGIALGKTIEGEVYVADIAKMPHLLIAGSTGSGKSIGINTILANILCRALPDEVQIALIDPKKLELSVYKKLINHHLLTVEGIDEDVITKPNNAVVLLKCLENEMERRYSFLAKAGVRNIEDYNIRISQRKDDEFSEWGKLNYIVVVIDELADLMITSGKEIEDSVARLAQMSRAVGIHLVIATQRPSVDVLTGVIKANFSSRIAYQVATKVDSRTIIDMNGAEQLIGKGDMLFLPTGEPKPIRLQNAFVSTEEIEKIVDHISKQPKFEKEKLSLKPGESDSGSYSLDGNSKDSLFDEAKRLVIIHQQGSISLLQRRLRIGYSRAARLIDQLEQGGIVGPFDGSKARKVLYDEDSLDLLDD
ncbi:DNA translocase FtsK 4TM domain-containing protein [candidate division KSB1 bacterium]